MRVLGTLLVLAGLYLLGTVVTGWVAWWTPAEEGASPSELASAISGRMMIATGGGVIALLVGAAVLLHRKRGTS